MTATTTRTTPSKAAHFADAAEALGWEVERDRLPGGGRLVICQRDGEIYELAWKPNDTGNLIFDYGLYLGPGVPPESYGDPVLNVKAALRDMALHRTPGGALLPFDPEHDDDAVILTALAGRSIEWTNSITGNTEDGELPRGGLHFKISDGPKGRVLHFPDRVHTGFRSVYLNSITKVK